MAATRDPAARECFHCGLPCPHSQPILVKLDGAERAFCCAGCSAVCQAIHAAGLDGFYQRLPSAGLGARPAASPARLDHFDLDSVQAEFVDQLGTVRRAQLLVEGIRCAACVWLIERSLERLTGVLEANVNLAEQRLMLRWDNNRVALSTILARLAAIGYSAIPFDPRTAETAMRRRNRGLLNRLAFAGFAMMNMLWISIALYSGADQDPFRPLFHHVGLALATPTLLYSGWPFLAGAARGLRHGHLSMDLPIALGVSVTYLYSAYVTLTPEHPGAVYFDTVVNFLFVILVGRYLEARSRQRALTSSNRLIDLQPRTATVLRGDDEETIAVLALRAGDVVRVRSGQRVPADGTVLEGDGALDEALLTGESLPVAKAPGSRVTAGTLLANGALKVRVEKLLRDSALGRMIRLVEDARASRPPIQRITDRIVPWFVAATLGLAAITFLWWLRQDFDQALMAATAVLIITCPCALGLATPMAMAVATGLGARHRILVKDGAALEALTGVDHVVLDKTGTVTHGRVAVTRVRWAEDLPLEEREALAAVASLERLAEHALAKAVVEHARDRGASTDLPVTGFLTRAGRGVAGEVAGRELVVGSARWLEDRAVQPHRELRRFVAEREAEGMSCVHVGMNGREIGVLALADELRAEAPAVVAALKARGLAVTLLSGDRHAVAECVGARLGAVEVLAEVLPEGKAAMIAELQRAGKRVLMVGDGVNDAPALAQADVGVALASGTDISADSAELVIVGERIDPLLDALALAERTLRTVRQNIALSVAYNAIMVPLAMAGQITPLLAALTMPASSLAVIGNATRIRGLFRDRVPGVEDRPLEAVQWKSSTA